MVNKINDNGGIGVAIGRALRGVMKRPDTVQEAAAANEAAQRKIDAALKAKGMPTSADIEEAQNAHLAINAVYEIARGEAGRGGRTADIQRFWPTPTGAPIQGDLDQNTTMRCSRQDLRFMFQLARKFTDRRYQAVQNRITPVMVGAATAATPTAGDLSANSVALPGRPFLAPAILLSYNGGFNANRSTLTLSALYNHQNDVLAAPATQAVRIAALVNRDDLNLRIAPTADAVNAFQRCTCKKGMVPGWDGDDAYIDSAKDQGKSLILPYDQQLSKWDAVLFLNDFNFGPISLPGLGFANFSNLTTAPASTAALVVDLQTGPVNAHKDSAMQLFASVDLDPANVFGQACVPGMPEFSALERLMGIQ